MSGFLGDERIGTRAWIKTDAIVSHGNSGGLAANGAGQIVGIPTRAMEDVGGYSQVRPIALGQADASTPLILAGSPIDRQLCYRGAVDRPRVQVVFNTWTEGVAGCTAKPPKTSYASGTREILALFDESNMAVGEDVVTQWLVNGDVVVRSGLRISSDAATGGCLKVSLYLDRGLPDGRFRVELFIGPKLLAAASAETSVGRAAAPNSANLTGRVVDVDSRVSVDGAVVFLLTQGTDPETWFGAPSEDQVVAFARTDGTGRFRIEGLEAGT